MNQSPGISSSLASKLQPSDSLLDGKEKLKQAFILFKKTLFFSTYQKILFHPQRSHILPFFKSLFFIRDASGAASS